MNEEKFHVGVKALFVNDKNQILVLKVNPKDSWCIKEVHWDLPGGRIEEGYSIEQTLRKEVKEEIGVDDFEILEHFDTNRARIKLNVENGLVGLLMIVYRCRLSDGNVEIKLNDESSEYKWADMDESKELLRFKFSDSLIEKLSRLESS